ncbi:MAG: xylan 1,4-beta-xylosidase [Oscillospiraceae bacterium]|nr:xylan 1,4-beta-xylosidase [Oscillospiraceae bacterium]
MAKKNRFEKVYTQGAMDILEIWIDTETGVNYLYRQSGYSGGLTPLLDKDGKPVVTLSDGFVPEKYN